MKIGCAALYPITRYGFPYSLDDYLKALGEMRAAGFDAVELEVDVSLNLEEYWDRVEEVKAELARQELTLSGVIGVVQQAFSTIREASDQDVRRFRRLTELIAELGCRTAVVCAYMPSEIEMVPGTEVYRGSPPLQVRVPPDFDWGLFWDSAVQRLAEMARIAGDLGQRLVIENRVGDFVNTSDGILRLIEEAGQENAGVLLDVAHTHATKEHLELVIPKLGERLMYVHLADNDGSASYHLPAGRGNIDFESVLRSLAAIGYEGYVNVDFGGVPAGEIWDEVCRGRQYFEGCLRTLQD
jgi:sugar phosphate isomerase/epimerase